MTSAQADCEARQVLNRIWEVRGFGATPTREQWASVLPWAEPLAGRTWLDGASTRKSADSILSLAMCVLGDAYRELGRPTEAAAAYRRAFELNHGAPCADYYASIVLRHNLSDYYTHAAVALRQSRSHWKQRPFLMRAFATLVTMFTSPRSLVGYWRDVAARERRIRELERRAAHSS